MDPQYPVDPGYHTPPDQRYLQSPDDSTPDALTKPSGQFYGQAGYYNTPTPYPQQAPYTPPSQQSPPTGGFSWPLTVAILGFTLILAIAAVAAVYAFRVGAPSTGVGANTSPAPATTQPFTQATATSAASAPTAAAASACAQQTGFTSGQTGPDVISSLFQSDVVFPADTLAYVDQQYNDGSYQFEIVAVCANNSSPNDVYNFYATNLPAQGWTQSATFPYAGDPTRSCGDSYCWVKGASPTRYVSLENVSAVSGNATVYTLRLGWVYN